MESPTTQLSSRDIRSRGRSIRAPSWVAIFRRSPGAMAQQPDLAATIAEPIAVLEALLQAGVVHDNVGAVSVGCVAPGGDLIRYRAFGWKRRNATDGTPWAANAGPDTIFRIGAQTHCCRLAAEQILARQHRSSISSTP